MSVKKRKTKTHKPTRRARQEFDENPEWTREDFRAARPVAEVMPELIEAAKRLRGRPKLEQPKQQVTLRLDAGTIKAFKAAGSGWQTRMNKALARAARRIHKVA